MTVRRLNPKMKSMPLWLGSFDICSAGATISAVIFGGSRNFAVQRISIYSRIFSAGFQPAIILRRRQPNSTAEGLSCMVSCSDRFAITFDHFKYRFITKLIISKM